MRTDDGGHRRNDRPFSSFAGRPELRVSGYVLHHVELWNFTCTRTRS